MGFFIGWRFFDSDDYYSFEAMEERAYQRDQETRRERAREKRRRKQAEAAKIRKQKIRDARYRESEQHQDMFNKQFGSGDPNYSDDKDPASLYKKYSGGTKEEYREETMRRYGYLYNGEQGSGEAPALNRMMGRGHHQGVRRNNKVNHHAPVGPLARRLRIPLGKDQFNPNNEFDKQHNYSGSGPKKGNGGNDGNSGSNGSGGGFFRPF